MAQLAEPEMKLNKFLFKACTVLLNSEIDTEFRSSDEIERNLKEKKETLKEIKTISF